MRHTRRMIHGKDHYHKGIDKKGVTPHDFYMDPPHQTPSPEGSPHSIDLSHAYSHKRQNLTGIEIAHLYGEKGCIDEIHMD